MALVRGTRSKIHPYKHLLLRRFAWSCPWCHATGDTGFPTLARLRKFQRAHLQQCLGAGLYREDTRCLS